MLRSGAYSDDIVRNLMRRRFVAVMYDVAPPGRNFGDGWAYDQAAVDVIGPIEKLRPRRATGGTQDRDGRVHAASYPAALFVLPDGTRLGNGLWGILPPERLVAELHAVMAKWPEHFAATDAERAIEAAATARPDDPAAQLAAATLAWELARFADVLEHTGERAEATATAAQRTELLLLRGRSLLCLDRDGEAAEVLARGALLAEGELAPAFTVFRARLAMRSGRHAEALAQLLPLTRYETPGTWTGAAMYYAGLCQHRLGREDEARAMWRRHRQELPFDRLARRSAASLGTDEAEAFLNQELLEHDGWW